MAQVLRAMDVGETRGMMKVVVDARTNQILGAAIFGIEGGEVMTVVQVARRQRRSRLWVVLPGPPLALWLSSIGYQCLTNWVSMQPGSITLGETIRCFATLVLTSLPLSLTLLLMLRYAAPLRPTSVIFAGSLAVAAITAVALSLFHSGDATIMILMWNLGTACLFMGLGGVFGKTMFSWVAPRPDLHRA